MKNYINDNKIKNKISFILILIILIVFLLVNNSYIVFAVDETNDSSMVNNTKTEENEEQFRYLSDISCKSAQVGYGKFILDKTASNTEISLYLEGALATFKKGIWAHATSTVIYDLSGYNYDYFTSYIGVNTTSGNKGNGVKFYIYTSQDGTSWTLKTDENPVAMMSSNNAMFVKIDIKGVKYLKLYASDNGANGNDHSVYADAKLIKEGYTDNVTKTVEEYDEEIKNQYVGQEISGEFEKTLLQRAFVKKTGNYVLKTFIEENELNKQTLQWLMNDVDSLRLYIVGGKPDGTYQKSLNVLTDLYNTYKDDLNNKTVTEQGVVLKDLYRKMMIALSLTHSTTVGLWTGPKTDVNSSNAVNRYAIYKSMHQRGLLQNDIFENLTIEEMRWVMNNIIDDEEIEWLNWYSTEKGSTNPYSYITYRFGYDYTKGQYYDKANYQKWNEKYGLSKYNVSYKTGYPKLWIVFEEGSVCGGLSKTGSNIWGARGVPSSVVSQPGHAAYIYYSLDANGNGIWNLYNDVSGWANSGRTEVLGIRMPNDWGTGSYATYTDTVKPDAYILLAQAAHNEYEKYEKCEEILLLTDVYKNDKTKLYDIYRKALEVEKINFDAWYGLVNLYMSDNTKTEKDYYNLAEEISQALTYYPLPMHDLMRIIQPKLTSPVYSTKFSILHEKALTTASKATEKESIQPNQVKTVANAILGIVDNDIAQFSFDGENAGKIMLAKKYEGIGVRWDYSLDGGKTWSETDEHIVKLSKEQLESITDENDIKVHIIGAGYEEGNIFTIDITKSNAPNLYNNDLENRVIGASNIMEWKLEADTDWTSFEQAEPDLTGDKTVEVRIKNNGTKLKSDSVSLNYTQDNQPDTQKYISISRLAIHQVSSEATANGGHAKNSIDGNINTIWHTAYDGSDSTREISIKLDKPTYISALEYVPRQSGSNGRLKNGKVLVSMDGTNWEEVGTITNWANNASRKTFELNEAVKANYVKLITTQNYGDGRNFGSAAMINLFEDTTMKEPETPQEPTQPEQPNDTEETDKKDEEEDKKEPVEEEKPGETVGKEDTTQPTKPEETDKKDEEEDKKQPVEEEKPGETVGKEDTTQPTKPEETDKKDEEDKKDSVEEKPGETVGKEDTNQPTKPEETDKKDEEENKKEPVDERKPGETVEKEDTNKPTNSEETDKKDKQESTKKPVDESKPNKSENIEQPNEIKQEDKLEVNGTNNLKPNIEEKDDADLNDDNTNYNNSTEKEDNNKEENSNINNKDTTTSKMMLPFTGSYRIITVIIAIILIVVAITLCIKSND